MPDNTNFIDNRRTAYLCDVGQPDYIATIALDTDGAEHLVLAQQTAIGDPNVTYDVGCAAAAHEQLGPLPLDVVKRITISSRTHRCGQRTKAGTPCRTPVHRHGETCAWHREHKTAKGQPTA